MQDEVDIKEELLRLLDYYKEQLMCGGCTMNAMLTFYKFLVENIDVVGTVEDFAKFYGVSESKVRHTISRYMVEKPKRRVFYPFHPFTKIIPRKWLNKR